MRIAVLVKQILDPRGITVRRDKERVFINKEEYVVDPGSLAAVEAALRIKDGGEATVIALSMGKPQADDALREALALGCDEAYLLCDEAFEQADNTVAANVLAAAMRKLGGADLVIAGRASGDTGAGQMGSRLAEALGYALATDLVALSVEGGRTLATRRWGDGYATVEAPLPAVFTVALEAFPPRYAPGDRIMDAYRLWDVTRWNADDLELDAVTLTPLLSFRGESFPPPLERDTLRGAPKSVAGELVLALRQQRLVP